MATLVEARNDSTYTVRAEIRIADPDLELFFSVTGDLRKLYKESVPEKPALSRGHDLWKRSCFECFFFDCNSPHYHEINVNPFGEYDFLSFSSYRKPLDSFKERGLNFFDLKSIESKTKLRELNLKVSLSMAKTPSLLCSPCVILTPSDSDALYFALRHHGKADFHRRESVESLALDLRFVLPRNAKRC